MHTPAPRYGVNLVSSQIGNTAMSLGASMVAAVQAIPEFQSERLTFERERNVGMNVFSFVAAKFLASLFVCALMPLIFVVVYVRTHVLHISSEHTRLFECFVSLFSRFYE